MNKLLYSDADNVYTILDYNRSHSELLIRKRVNAFNTDILFKSVRGIFLPMELRGIEITLIVDESEISLLEDRYFFSTEYGIRIYSIRTSNNKMFYLNAGVFGVFNNELDILRSSIGDFTWSVSNKLVFWSEDK